MGIKIEIDNRKNLNFLRGRKSKKNKKKKIEKTIIEKVKKIEVEIEKRISIFFSIHKFLYQKLFKRILNVNAGFSK